MESSIHEAVLRWAEESAEVLALFQSGPRANAAAIQKNSLPYYYLAVMAKGSAPDRAAWENRFQPEAELIQFGLVETDPAQYRIFLSDSTRITLTVVEDGAEEAVLATDSLATVVYDPAERFSGRAKPTDLSRRTRKPSPEEYALWCGQFFRDISDTACALEAEQLSVAQLCLDRARRSLLSMTCAAVASGSSFLVNLGENGMNMKAYMDEVEYDHLLRSYAQTHPMRIWDAVFQACMLFRKSGLKLNELEEFTYPKKLDVEMMQYLRKIWEEAR